MMKQIPFKFKFNRKSSLLQDAFVDIYDANDEASVLSQGKDSNFHARYIKLLDDITGGKIKPSTLVDIDLMDWLQQDIANRGYLNAEHCDDVPVISNYGRFLMRRAAEMKQYIKECA